MSAALMPLAEARAFVYPRIEGDQVLPGAVHRLTRAMVSLALFGDDRDQDTARAVLTLFLVRRQKQDSDPRMLHMTWSEAQFIYVLTLFEVLDYAPEVFMQFMHTLALPLPDPRAADEGLLDAIGLSRKAYTTALCTLQAGGSLEGVC